MHFDTIAGSYHSPVVSALHKSHLFKANSSVGNSGDAVFFYPRHFAPKTLSDVTQCLEALKFRVQTFAGGVSLYHWKKRDAKCSPWDFPNLEKALNAKPGRTSNLSSLFYQMDDFDPNTDRGKQNIETIITRPKPFHPNGLYKGFGTTHEGKTREAGELMAKMFARKPPPSGKPYKTCAIVGGSKQLYGRGLGKEIDSAEAVFRINGHPVAGFEEDVGRRTTARYIYVQGLYGLVAQIVSRVVFNLHLPKCLNVFGWADKYPFFESAETAQNYDTNSERTYTLKYWMDAFCSWRNDSIIWHGIDSFDMRVLEALTNEATHNATIWLTKKKEFSKDRLTEIFRHTDIPLGTVVDSTGEIFWRKALGFCEQISLYGFTFAGDTMRYGYYWSSHPSFVDSAYAAKHELVKNSRPYDPDDICRRQNVARTAVAACMGFFRIGDGTEEYFDMIDESVP